MYYLNAAYHASVRGILATIPGDRLRAMKAQLRGDGYADDDEILTDEVHAYLLDGQWMDHGWHQQIQRNFIKFAPKPLLGTELIFGPAPSSDDEDSPSPDDDE